MTVDNQERWNRRPRIAVIPGDGIGVETVNAALVVLGAVESRWGPRLELETFPWGCDFYKSTGAMMPPEALERLSTFDAIFFGAVGDPSVPDDIAVWDLVLAIRRRFGQNINVRPVRRFDGVPSPLRDDLTHGMDFVVVRENGEGEYSRVGGIISPESDAETALQVSTFSRHGVERVARYAFEIASRRRRSVISATKSNALAFSMPFWDRVVADVGASFPEVALVSMHADALAARLVLSPGDLDVVVASNLFGDILSDLGAALMGSIGMGASANLDPSGRSPSMFEPIHGSAPDIAGQGVANPVGQIWSLSMMLDHLGYPKPAAAIVRSIERVLVEGDTLTPDLGGGATCVAVAEAIASRVCELGAG